MSTMTSQTLSTILGILLLALDIYVIGRAINRDHGVERTLAWIFAILAFPAGGALAYIFLASPGIKRTTRKKRLSKAAVRKLLSQQALAPRTVEHYEIKTENVQSLLSLASSLTEFPPTKGNTVELMVEDNLAFKRIEAAIEAAERSIWAEYYLIKNDVTGSRFLRLLSDKTAQGVEVRLLYDAVGSMRLDARHLKAISESGGKVAAFLPVNPFRRRWSVHLRNHRKLIVVDNTLGFTGGMNVGDEYSGRARRKGKQHFRDSHLAIRGPAVFDLSRTFAEDWLFATEKTLICPQPPAPEEHGTSIVSILASGPDQHYNANGMVYFSGIASAKNKVYLTSPYFIPDEPLLRALYSAALSGLDVRLLVPAHPDVAIVSFAARSYFPALIRAGVRIFKYQKSMLHAKSIVVDGIWGMVGSANVDIRSFRLNFELNALIIDPDFAAKLEQRFLSDLGDSTEVTEDMVTKRPFTEKLRVNLAKLLSPLL